MNKDEILSLAEQFARCYSYTDVEPLARAKLVAALDAADTRMKNIESMHTALAEAHSNVLAENEKLRLELENCVDLLKVFEAHPESCIGAAVINGNKALGAARVALGDGK